MSEGLTRMAPIAAAVLLVALAARCSKPAKDAATDTKGAPDADAPAEMQDLALPKEMRGRLEQPFTGDFDATASVKSK